MATQKEKIEKKQLEVKADTFTGSLYSQFVGVTVTDLDITLEFVFINTRTGKHGEVVSRVTLPRQAGEGLAKVIMELIEKHDARKKEV